MLYFDNYNSVSSYSGFWTTKPSATIQGLEITRPCDINKLEMRFPFIIALKIDFWKTGFKKKSIDHNAHLKELCEAFSVVHLEFRGSADRIQGLPNILLDYRLRFLSVDLRGSLGEFDILSKLEHLEYLKLSAENLNYDRDLSHLKKLKYCHILCKSLNKYHLTESSFNTTILSKLVQLEELTLSANIIKAGSFSNFTRLKSLHITCETIDETQSIGHLASLETLHLSINKTEKFDFDFSNCTNLKYLTITNCKQLKELPNFKGLDQLERLRLFKLPALQMLPEDWHYLKGIDQIEISAVGDASLVPLTISQSLKRLPSLGNLSLVSKNIIDQKENSSFDFPMLFNLSINGTLFSSILSQNKLSKLTNVYVTIPDSSKYVVDFDKIPAIKRLEISSNRGELSLLNLENSQHLSVLKIQGFKNITGGAHLGGNNLALKELSIIKCSNFDISPSIYDCPLLERIGIDSTDFNELPLAKRGNSSISFLNLGTEVNLPSLPESISQLENLAYVTLNKSQSRQANVINEILTFFRKDKTASLQRKVILSWFLFDFSNNTIPPNFIQDSLMLLKAYPPFIRNQILNNIQFLNPDKRAIDWEKIRTSQANVVIIGKTGSTKRILNQKLQALGFQSTTTSKEANYVLVGDKADFDDSFFEKERFYFTEHNLLEQSKKIEKQSPTLLESRTDLLNNLQQLFWSDEPENEKIAFEIIKSNGLFDAILPDLVIAAKSSKDASVKSKIKRWLKGKVDPEISNILSAKVNFRKPSFRNKPFEVLNKAAPNVLLSPYAYAVYKKLGNYGEELFKYDDGTSPHRREVLDSLLPNLLKKTRTLGIYMAVNAAELGYILDQESLKGRLENLTLYSSNLASLPAQLSEHTSIKKLEILAPVNWIEIPKVVFDLYKLKELRIECPKLERVSPNIEQLKRLSSLILGTTISMELPESVATFKMLKTCFLKGGISNKKYFTERLEGCRIGK